MPHKDFSQARIDIATEIALYDLFRNPAGPTYNELWLSFVRSKPGVAKVVLDFANEQSDGNAQLRDAILSMAVKMAALHNSEGPFSPLHYLETASELGRRLSMEEEVAD